MTHRDVEDGAMLVEVVLYVPLVAALIWLVLWPGHGMPLPTGSMGCVTSSRSKPANRGR